MQQLNLFGYGDPISYSGLSLYRECPRRWKDTYIDKNRYDAGPAAARGTRIHEKLEQFFLGGEYPYMSQELAPWVNIMHTLRESPGGVMPELKLGACPNWTPEEFHNSTGQRGAIDLSLRVEYTVEAIDWKTGKIYPKHEEQGKFYVCLQAAHEPDAKLYRAKFVYIDHPKKILEWDYSPQQVADMQGAFSAEIDVIRLDNEWKPSPSESNCKWCPLNWRKGGTCEAAP